MLTERQKYLNRLGSFATREGDKAIPYKVIRAAIRFFDSLPKNLRAKQPKQPKINPASDGEIYFEWWSKKADLIVCVDKTGKTYYIRTDEKVKNLNRQGFIKILKDL